MDETLQGRVESKLARVAELNAKKDAMSDTTDTTGWTRMNGSYYYKNLPHCRIEVTRRGGGGWRANIELNNDSCAARADAQRLAHAMASALGDMK